MRILLISPLGCAVNKTTKYAGIERLVWEFSRELTRQSHQVTVIGPAGSEYPQGVSFLPAPVTPNFVDAELKSFQLYQGRFRQFDAIHDFSHQHCATRFQSAKLPCVSAFWHAPGLAKYLKAPYNIMAPSQWAAREYERVYEQKARVADIIIIDTEVYKPNGKPRTDRFMCLGRMGPEKGNLNAVKLCNKFGMALDVCGGRGFGRDKEPLDAYELEVVKGCDGQRVVFRGEVDDTEKVRLMQSCKGLVYMTDHPEITSHKIQEAMICGAPVVVPRLGALSEIVADGSNGYLCATAAEYEYAVRHTNDLNVETLYEAVRYRWFPETVVGGYIKVYEDVANGARW